ncbi:MAG: glycosyltransferase family 2 protein [Candidatus Scatovivens sp.]
MDKISVIVPCFNEEKALSLFYEELNKISKEEFKESEFEIILVDDGSKDNTLKVIKNLKQKDERIVLISFSRNFGKEAAILAGLDNATGDYVVMMDADMQDPPSLLRKMYDIVKGGEYDCAATRRVTRKGEPKIRSFFARQFYKIIDKMTDFEMVDGARDYRFMTKQMADSVANMKEYNRFSKGLFSFVGFKTKWIEYENIERVAGETKWSFWKLFKYALEGIVAFSTTPLVLSSVLGMIFCILAAIIILIIIIKTLVFGDPTSGWPSLACIIVFVSGVQLLFLGIIGQYMSKMYLEVKKRPIYIIKEKK